MKTLHVINVTFICAVAGCSGDKVNLSALKRQRASLPESSPSSADKSGDLMQGQKNLSCSSRTTRASRRCRRCADWLQYVHAQHAHVGGFEITARSNGNYKVTSNFAMSGHGTSRFPGTGHMQGTQPSQQRQVGS